MTPNAFRHTAYLIVQFDLGGVAKLGVFTEPHPTPRHFGMMSGIVAHATGWTLEEALIALRNYLVSQMPWLIPEFPRLFHGMIRE